MMNWIIFSPEFYFLMAGIVFLGFSMTRRVRPEQVYFIALILASVGIGVCLACVRLTGDLFSGTYRIDLFSQVFKVMLSMGLFLVICLCTELDGIEQRLHPEFYFLLIGTELLIYGIQMPRQFLAPRRRKFKGKI